MRVLVVSDTHRSNSLYLQLTKKYAPLDMVIHCGDLEGAEYTIESVVDCPVHMVAGNNDFFSNVPLEDEFMLAGHKVFLTHGHHYYISMGNELVKDEAKNRGCDIVMYGHTHRPVVEYSDGITAINPGSLTYPRQEGRKPTYIIIETDDRGELDIKVHYLP